MKKKKEWSWHKQNNGNGATIFPICCGNLQIIFCWSKTHFSQKRKNAFISVFIQLQRYNLRHLCYRLRHEASLIVMIQNNISDNCSSDGVAWEMERCIFHFLKRPLCDSEALGDSSSRSELQHRRTMPLCRWHSITAKFSPLRSSGEWSDYRLSVHL